MKMDRLFTPFKPQPFDPRTLLGQVGGLVKQSLTGGGVVDISPQYEALMERQMELNQQMTEISMRSNLEKARHDARMAVIRNMRVQ